MTREDEVAWLLRMKMAWSPEMKMVWPVKEGVACTGLNAVTLNQSWRLDTCTQKAHAAEGRRRE